MGPKSAAPTAGAPAGSRTAPPLSPFVVYFALTGLGLTVLLAVAAEATHVLPVAFAAVLVGALLYLQFQVFRRPATWRRTRWGSLALGAELCLVYLPVIMFGRVWLGILGFAAGTALLVLRPMVAWPLFGAISVSGGILEAIQSSGASGFALITVVTAVTGLVVYGLSRLRALAADLHMARSELAGLAVVQERQRFSRDLHDLLGFSLCAIILKIELAHRLVRIRPEPAQQEIGEVIAISRQALADVRAVASSHRELSLDNEIALARSVLAAAEVEVTIRYLDVELPAPVHTTLAIVLREGVTNLLRHSRATRCEITIDRTEDVVSLTIMNDGAPQPPPDPRRTTGSGTRNLAGRVEAMGGTVTTTTAADQTYTLRAGIPVANANPAAPLATRPDQDDDGPAVAPRLARLVVYGVCATYAVYSLLMTIRAGVAPPGVALCATAIAVMLVLQLAVVSRPEVVWPSRLGYTTLLAMAVTVYGPMVAIEQPTASLPGFLAGSTLLVFSRRVRWVVFGAVMASVAVLYSAFSDHPPLAVASHAVGTLSIGLVVYGLLHLRSLVVVLQTARADLAEQAVASQRERFGRELQDLLGPSLSAITLSSVLIHRMAEDQPERAQSELSELLGTARQSLADVRLTSSSYRVLSLENETATARALLAAADIAVTVDHEVGDLPEDVRTALASVLREGVTNLLQHSEADQCQIRIRSTGHLVSLTIDNNGVVRLPVHATTGTGIGNLASRVDGLGGRLVAGRMASGYRIHAEIPLRRAS